MSIDNLKRFKKLFRNYEEILKCHRNSPQDKMAEINDETKFEIVRN